MPDPNDDLTDISWPLSTVLYDSCGSLRAAFLECVLGFLISDCKADGTVGVSTCNAMADVTVNRSPQVISLRKALPPVAYDLTKQSFPVGRHLGDVFSLLAESPFDLCDRLPAGLDLHQCSRQALAEVVSPGGNDDGGDVAEVEVFTDGCFDGRVSSWALVLL